MTALVQVRVDKKLKEEAEELFNELGLDTTTALRMFLKAAVREQKIPFKLNRQKQDPFYSEENLAELRQSIKELDDGKRITFTLEEFNAMNEAIENAKSKEEVMAIYKKAEKEHSNA
ncbi:type II toxin-antitoxin system RelB/DinJ family antitoxin [Helicobacter sp. MIT 21-1697]|uniref:type II toxin-antitoxin system RelB/DinJ family antitoxin n=1 Tax=Helicobacter sp. MIT 21-1697 TaxID=2993733 RepID=UPI00224A8638|nr:type II toxin-antitoxin system RelB/DinJ family antitoxin [Helicobacter sp. MIT 21-1697]MCX2717449.1 type II toxin-antitoxin system RelB/DinJ family antitoxin [Helicobacter sp. MIT 21-1697]